MMKMDLGSGSGSNIFQMNDDDIRLLTELLECECGRRIYNDEKFSHYKHFKAEYDHMQEMIKELNKK